MIRGVRQSILDGAALNHLYHFVECIEPVAKSRFSRKLNFKTRGFSFVVQHCLVSLALFVFGLKPFAESESKMLVTILLSWLGLILVGMRCLKEENDSTKSCLWFWLYYVFFFLDVHPFTKKFDYCDYIIRSVLSLVC